MDVVVIHPEPGQMSQIAKLLMQLADNPHQVRYVSHPAAGFEVSVELFAQFEAAFPQQTSDVSDQSSDPNQAPAKKKPGRPRKKQGEEE